MEGTINFKSSGIHAPCKGCHDRFVGCHDKCLKYIDYKQRIETLHREDNIAYGYTDYMYTKKQKKRYRQNN